MNPMKWGVPKHKGPKFSCLFCENRQTIGTTPVCAAFNPPKTIAGDETTSPKSCPKRRKSGKWQYT